MGGGAQGEGVLTSDNQCPLSPILFSVFTSRLFLIYYFSDAKGVKNGMKRKVWRATILLGVYPIMIIVKYSWSERSACAALGCWHKRRWPL